MDDSEESFKRLTVEWTRAQPAVGRFVRSFVHSFVRNRADADDAGWYHHEIAPRRPHFRHSLDTVLGFEPHLAPA